MKIQKQQVPPLLLRAGLAVVFLFAAIGSLLHPDQWIGYLPTFIEKMSDATSLLRVFAIFELVLAVWLLSGKFVKYAAAVAALALISIVVAQPSEFSTLTFRDLGLACMAVALVLL